MVAHKLRIACVLGLAIFGFGPTVEAASLTLAWDHSTSSNAVGYQVSYGTQSGKYTATVKAGYVTSVLINGLTEGTTYYFSVQSYDSAGTLGSPAPEISGKAPASASLPVLSISCPSPVLTSPDGNPISVTLTPTVSGGVAPISTSCSPASGSLFSVGTTSFSCTAVDAAQQKASCASTVVVAAPNQTTAQPQPNNPKPPPPGQDKEQERDSKSTQPGQDKQGDPETTTSPAPEPAPDPTWPAPDPGVAGPTPTLPAGDVTLVCPAIPPIKEEAQSGKAVVEFADPLFSDGTVPVTVSCSPKSGSQFRIGTTTVACSATNAANQLFSCTTTVTITDRPKLSNGGGL